jgi:hypothetical protein
MEANVMLKNTNIEIKENKKGQAFTFWDGSKIIARIEFEDGKVSFSLATENA